MAVSFAGAKKYKKHNGFYENAEVKIPFEASVHFFPLRQGDFVLEPMVKADDKVLGRQKIADIAEFAVNPVICSISGRVLYVTPDIIAVENDMLRGRLALPSPVKSADELTTREILWLLREGGVYETRYRTPLHVLLSDKKVADCIIVCCFDSDPYISSPQAAAMGSSEKILRALEIAMRVSGITKAYVAVENDTKRTYSDFKLNLRYNDDISLCCFKARYPQSRSDILINTVTGNPLTNAMILSPETLADMADVLEKNVPVTRKIVTVSGDDILEPNNFSVPLGMPFSSLLECGGYSSPEIVINGGVIDGERINDLDTPVTADTAAVLAFNDKNNIPKYRKNLI